MLSPVGGWYDCIFPVLNHVQHQTLGKSLCSRVEVAQNRVAAPPTHQSDHVGVHDNHENVHAPLVMHGMGAFIFRFESNGVPTVVKDP